MAVELDHVKLRQFEHLFAEPTLAEMQELSWSDFELFIAHVFTAAGYLVEHIARHTFPHGPGFDLNLYASKTGSLTGKPLARVEVRHYAPTNLLDTSAVMEFIGKIIVAGGIPGFLVTTSDFTGPAYQAAAAHPKTFLLNGERLLRYITYVGGSRLDGEFAGIRVAPQEPITPSAILASDSLAPRDPEHLTGAKILAVANNKGGVAKTTTALNLGFALAEQHEQRVLLIDIDAQASLTMSLPAPSPGPTLIEAAAPPREDNIANYFRGQALLPKLARPTQFKHLWLIPSSSELVRLDSGGVARPGAELAFIRDVRQLAEMKTDGKSAFDWIILDTPPAQSYFTRLALAAADRVLVPANAETYASQGLNRVFDTIRTMHVLTGNLATWKSQVLGCLITRWKPSKTAQATQATLLVELGALHIPIFGFTVPHDDKIEQALLETAKGKLKHIFKLASVPGPAAQAYERLAKEVLTWQ